MTKFYLAHFCAIVLNRWWETISTDYFEYISRTHNIVDGEYGKFIISVVVIVTKRKLKIPNQWMRAVPIYLCSIKFYPHHTQSWQYVHSWALFPSFQPQIYFINFNDKFAYIDWFELHYAELSICMQSNIFVNI